MSSRRISCEDLGKNGLNTHRVVADLIEVGEALHRTKLSAV